MKQIYTQIAGVIVLMVFLVPTVYGDSTNTTPSGRGTTPAGSATPASTGDPTAMLLVEQGEQLMREGNQTEGALASFDLAIQINPTFSRAYFQASAAASQSGNYGKAISYLEALRKFEPNNPQIQGLLANLETKKSQQGQANPFSSGFFEFGVFALLGLVFFFVVAGYELGGTSPRGAAWIAVAKPYFVYPMLKVIWQGAQRELLTLHEKRHKSIHWQARYHAV